MQFNDIIGQTTAIRQLREMVDHERLPHALLLLGNSGSGSLAVALALVQYVLCENRNGSEPCGVCKQCTKASKWIHPDIHYAYPTIKLDTKEPVSTDLLVPWRAALQQNPYMSAQQWFERLGAENKQGNITAKECVDIVRKLSFKAYEGRYKVLVLWLPEYLQKEGNRLLKIIEEPPENTLFILVAENQELILPTILSRCQLVKILPLQDSEIEEALMKQFGMPKSEALTIAHLAEGDWNEALALIDQSEQDRANLFLDWMRKCYRGDAAELVQWVEKFAPLGREKQKHFLQYGLHFLREMLVLILTGSDYLRLLPAELETARRMSSALSFNKIEALTQLFNDCIFYIERNANPKILMLDASLNINRTFNQKK